MYVYSRTYLIGHGVATLMILRRMMMMLRNVQRKIQTLVSLKQIKKIYVCIFPSSFPKKKYCRAICRSRFLSATGQARPSFLPSFLPSTLFTVNGLDKREFVDSIRSMFCMVRTREIRASAFSKRESLNLVFMCS